jgi:tetratricopeptide (TPR) repeat protein
MGRIYFQGVLTTVKARLTLVSIYMSLFDLENCKKYHNEAISLARELLGENHFEVLKQIVFFGEMLDFFEEYQESAQCFKQVEKTLETTNTNSEPDFVDILFSMAEHFRKVHNDDKALNHYTRCMKLEKGKTYVKYIPLCLIGSGKLAEKGGLFEYALELYEQAFNIMFSSKKELSMSNVSNMIKAQNVKGNVFRKLGGYQQCFESHQEALELINRSTLPQLEKNLLLAGTYDYLGKLQLSSKKCEQAAQYFHKSLKLRLIKNSTPLIQKDLHVSFRLLGRCNQEQQKWDLANSHYEKAIQVLIEKFGKNFPKLIKLYREAAVLANSQRKENLVFDYMKKAIAIADYLEAKELIKEYAVHDFSRGAHVWMRMHLGFYYSNYDLHEDAADTFIQAIETDYVREMLTILSTKKEFSKAEAGILKNFYQIYKQAFNKLARINQFVNARKYVLKFNEIEQLLKNANISISDEESSR